MQKLQIQVLNTIYIGEMKNSFRRAELDDFGVIKSTFMKAFWDDPIMRWLFPYDSQFRKLTGMADYLRKLVAYNHGLVTPDVVAFSLWIPPGRPDVEVEGGTESTEVPTEELISKFVALMNSIVANTPREEHWYLQFVGTHPDWQGQGIGSMLIREGLSWARRDGLGVYLETETIENVAYYRHLGFEVRTEWDITSDGPHMWGMWHPARE